MPKFRAISLIILTLIFPQIGYTATIASDTFTRSVGSGWGTADVGGSWTNGWTSSVDGSVGIVNLTIGGYSFYQTLSLASVENSEITGVTSTSYNSSGQDRRVVSRTNDFVYPNPPTNCYLFIISAGNTIYIFTTNSGSDTQLGTVSKTIATSEKFRCRTITSGSDTLLKCSFWDSSTSEPGAWDLEVTDSTTDHINGKIALGEYGGGGNIDVTWDNFLVDDTAAAGGGLQGAILNNCKLNNCIIN